ncbi:hypothetical protein [Pseudomonas baltica]|uniref:hypothetical protein n=1 Tax=Pseudomonas baltica TaxID=2762576 RepID=UPI0028984106|nr:hypothetical protein [Pseudomonas baltica]
MLIQVILRHSSDGLATQRQADALACAMGKKAPMVYAEAYDPQGLLGILEVRAAGGNREMLVLNCSAEQVLAALEWQSCTEENVEFEDLVLHLVRVEPRGAVARAE